MKDKRSLDWRQTIDTEYDILNLWNLPKGLGLKVKIGSFSTNVPFLIMVFEHTIKNTFDIVS